MARSGPARALFLPSSERAVMPFPQHPRAFFFSLFEMVPHVIILIWILALHCAADQCDWTGSGFAAGVDPRLVLQVRLRCTEGWVRWLNAAQALRLLLEPNVSSVKRGHICIQPTASFGGVSVFIERAARLQALVTDNVRPARQVICFRLDGGTHRTALFLQPNPSSGTQDRRQISFRYELLLSGGRKAAALKGGSCRPCSDAELLMAVCNSDFVVRAHIINVSHDSERQTSSIEVSASRVYWQRSAAFEEQAARRPSSWRGRIHTLLACQVKPGDGEFLFTGLEHFGEAWLGCAPRYSNFLKVYLKAVQERQNSCNFPLD